MGLILYECAPEFPAKIPRILRDEGFVVAPGRWRQKIREGKNDFIYAVTDGVCVVDVFGGEEDDGTVGLLITCHWSWRPTALLRRKAFYDRVTGALLRAGAQVWIPPNEKEA